MGAGADRRRDRGLDLRPVPQRDAGLTGAARTVLITGCGSGIGHAAAHLLAQRGWRVLATCRTEADAARLGGEGLESFALDQSDDASVAGGMAEALERTGGRLDALVNNGAFAVPGAVEDLPRDALRAIFEANVFGVHDLTCRAIPAMRAAGAGRIVTVSSVLGYVAAPWRGAYVATKFALEGLSDSLRMEMAGTGIDVVLVQPGPIATRFRENAARHFEEWVDWEGSARADEYRNGLLERLYGGKADRFQLPAEAAARVIARAVETPRPAPRYQVTWPARMGALARRGLSTRMLDRMMSRS